MGPPEGLIRHWPKIISELCELVELCDINCSGPVFVETL